MEHQHGSRGGPGVLKRDEIAAADIAFLSMREVTFRDVVAVVGVVCPQSLTRDITTFWPTGSSGGCPVGSTCRGPPMRN